MNYQDDNNNYKRLHKSQTDKFICGICGGIGEYHQTKQAFLRCEFSYGKLYF